MKTLQITPHRNARLYDALIKKQENIQEGGRGTYVRAGRKSRNKATWHHKKFKGAIDLARGVNEAVTAKIRSRVPEDERRMTSSFLGFVDRHCGDDILAITIQYR